MFASDTFDFEGGGSTYQLPFDFTQEGGDKTMEETTTAIELAEAVGDAFDAMFGTDDTTNDTEGEE